MKEVKLSKELEKTCPEGYPWECRGCVRKNGSTIPCSGRKTTKKEKKDK